ncbi:MAG TPA: glycosyltransferase WbuB [Firmicutes bacterium]|nr:glycosyltransferase WbuB [Bacillota bacterium]
MNILFINHNLKGEGTYFRCFNFARHLAMRGHSVTLLTVSPDKLFSAVKTTDSGVKIIETPKFLDQHRGGWGPLDTAYKFFHVLKNKYDIIHGFDHKPNVCIPSLAGRFFHKKTLFISDWADWWTKGGISSASRLTPEIMIETHLEESIRRKADAITVISTALMKRAESLGIKKDKILNIPSGCDTENIKPVSARKTALLKRKYGIPQKKKVLEFIGFGQGDVDLLVQAFNLLRKKRRDIVLLIVGPADRNTAGIIEKSPYKEDIIATGRVSYDRIPGLTAAADIFLLPLRNNIANEARWPNKIGDYLSAGRPVVANPTGDVRHVIRKYKTGLCSAPDPRAMAEKISILLGNKRLMKKYGINALKTAKSVLSWEKLTDKLERFYKKVMTQKGRR